MRRYGNNPAATTPWKSSIAPSALSLHTRDKVAIAIYEYDHATPSSRPPQLGGYREAIHAIPKTVYADNK